MIYSGTTDLIFFSSVRFLQWFGIVIVALVMWTEIHYSVSNIQVIHNIKEIYKDTSCGQHISIFPSHHGMVELPMNIIINIFCVSLILTPHLDFYVYS